MKTIDESIFIPVLESGEKLYHYTTAAGMLGICGGEFWVTESNFLNDFTEFHVATDIFCEVIDKHVQNEEARKKIKEKVCAEIKRLNKVPAVGDSVAYGGNYVISFSLDCDSTLMWSEYSDFHGYCLTFDCEKLYHAFGNQHTIQQGKVVYDHDTQIQLMEKSIETEFINWKTGFDYLNSWEDFNKLTDEEIDDMKPFLALIVEIYNQFFKLPCFAGENEYRFVFYCGHQGGLYKPEQLDKQYFRVKDEVFIPYVKMNVSIADALEGVLIGPKNNSDIAVLGTQRFLRNINLEVPVVKSQMPLRY